jgi:hypothetical protein
VSSLHFRLFNLTLCITIPDARALRVVARLLCPFRCRPMDAVTHRIDIRSNRTVRGARTVDIVINDEVRHRRIKRGELVPYLEWVVNALIVQTQGGNGQALIHAAVAARGATGVMICGKGGCGKSSLSLALLRRRYRYLTDEIACWDFNQEKILAYPKAITLKEYGYERFRQARIRLPVMWRGRAFGEKLWYISPKPHADLRPVNVRLMIFPIFRASATMQLRPLSKGRAITFLHRQRFDGNGFGRQDFESMTDLVKHAPAYQLVYSDVFQAAALVDSLTRGVDRA